MLIKSKPNTARMYLGPCQDITQDSDRPFLISYFIKWYTHFEFEKLTHGFMSQSQNNMLMLSLQPSIFSFPEISHFFHLLEIMILTFISPVFVNTCLCSSLPRWRSYCVCQEVRCYLPLASYRNHLHQHHHHHQQHHNHNQVGGTMTSPSKEMSYFCNLN